MAWRNLPSLWLLAHQKCEAGWWDSTCCGQCFQCSHQQHQGWVNEQQSCWHSRPFMALGAFGKSSQPLPCKHRLQCRSAIPQLHPQGPSLATASLQSMAFLPQQDCPLLVGPSDCLWQCSLSPSARPILLSLAQAEVGLMLCWFPKETMGCATTGASLTISSPSSMAAGMPHFGAPGAAGARLWGSLYLAGLQQVPSTCSPCTDCPGYQQSLPSRFGGQEPAEDNLLGALWALPRGGSVGKRCSYGGTRCLSFSWDML